MVAFPGGVAIFLATKLCDDLIKHEVESRACIKGTDLTINGKGVAGERQMDRIAVFCTACSFFDNGDFNPCGVMEKSCESLNLLFNPLTQLWGDLHLFTFDDNLHGLPSLSELTT